MTADPPKFTEDEVRRMTRDVPRSCPHCGAERTYAAMVYPAYVSFPCGLGFEWMGARTMETSPCRRGAPPAYERFVGPMRTQGALTP